MARLKDLDRMKALMADVDKRSRETAEQIRRNEAHEPALLTVLLTVAVVIVVVSCLTACESRHLTHTWPDGSVSEYQRTTLGRSNTEGVTLEYGTLKATLEASGSSEGELVSAAVQAAVNAAMQGAGQ